MMEAVFSSEMYADFERTTQYYTKEDGMLNNHRCENLMSCINGVSLLIVIRVLSLLDYLNGFFSSRVNNTRETITDGERIMVWGDLGLF
jgi:hypothetical protein